MRLQDVVAQLLHSTQQLTAQLERWRNDLEALKVGDFRRPHPRVDGCRLQATVQTSKSQQELQQRHVEEATSSLVCKSLGMLKVY